MWSMVPRLVKPHGPETPEPISVFRQTGSKWHPSHTRWQLPAPSVGPTVVLSAARYHHQHPPPGPRSSSQLHGITTSTLCQAHGHPHHPLNSTQLHCLVTEAQGSQQLDKSQIDDLWLASRTPYPLHYSPIKLRCAWGKWKEHTDAAYVYHLFLAFFKLLVFSSSLPLLVFQQVFNLILSHSNGDKKHN